MMMMMMMMMRDFALASLPITALPLWARAEGREKWRAVDITILSNLPIFVERLANDDDDDD